MPGLRIMTYNVRRFRSHREGISPVFDVIAAAAPDILALQDIDDRPGCEDLQNLAQRLGMRCYIAPGLCGNAFLSYYPLHHLQSFSLGKHGFCLRAELDVGQKRMHLYNVRMEGGRDQHREQIESLLGEGLLGDQRQGIPALILGDFGDHYRGGINWDLIIALQRITKPFVHGTFPSWFPVLTRDRAYLLGDLRVLAIEVIRSSLARQASTHLPLLLTVEISNARKYLLITPGFSVGKYEIAAG